MKTGRHRHEAEAIADGGTVFLRPGVYDVGTNPITIVGKILNIVWLTGSDTAAMSEAVIHSDATPRPARRALRLNRAAHYRSLDGTPDVGHGPQRPRGPRRRQIDRAAVAAAAAPSHQTCGSGITLSSPVAESNFSD